MSAETDVIAALRGGAAIIAALGDDAIERIASDYVAQEYDLPVIVVQRAGTVYTNVIHGGPPVAQDVTMDTICIAETRTAAETLADLVVIALAEDFLVVDRRQEFDPDPITYMAIVTCQVSLP